MPGFLSLLPITTVQASQIENALVNVHKQCVTKLANMKVQGRLQLLIIIGVFLAHPCLLGLSPTAYAHSQEHSLFDLL